MTFAAELRSIAAGRGLDVSVAAAESMQEHARLLRQWNRAAKLTSQASESEILERHFLEALEGLRFLPAGAGRLVDVGAGGGFPSLPLLVCRADLTGELLEPNTRKRAFLKEVIRSVGLAGRVSVRPDRVDSPDDLDALERFDVLTARAVGQTAVLLAAAAARLRAGGCFLLFAGEAVRGTLPPRPLSLEIAHRLPGRDASYLLVYRASR